MKTRSFYPFLLLISLFFILSSCGKPKNAFEFSTQLPASNWNKFSPLSYNFQQTNPSDQEYKLVMEVQHSNLVRPKDLFFDLIITSPTGEERIKTTHFWIKDKHSSFKGTVLDETYTVEQTIYTPISLNSEGKWTFEISPRFYLFEIEGIQTVSLKAVPIKTVKIEE